MSRSLIDYLEHISTEAEFLVDVSANFSLDQLLTDELRKRAIVRSLEIIGEAAKKWMKTRVMRILKWGGEPSPVCVIF